MTEARITRGWKQGRAWTSQAALRFQIPPKASLHGILETHRSLAPRMALLWSGSRPEVREVAEGISLLIAPKAQKLSTLDTRHSTLLHPLPVTLHSSLSWKRRCPASSSGWGIAIRLFIMSRRSGITRGWIFMEGGMMCFSIGRILRCRICSGSCQ